MSKIILIPRVLGKNLVIEKFTIDKIVNKGFTILISSIAKPEILWNNVNILRNLLTQDFKWNYIVITSELCIKLLPQDVLNMLKRYVIENNCKIICIGPNTAKIVENLLSIKNVEIPDEYSSLGLCKYFRNRNIGRILILRSCYGEQILLEELNRLNFYVYEVMLYKFSIMYDELKNLNKVIDQVYAIIFTSKFLANLVLTHLDTNKLWNKIFIVLSNRIRDEILRHFGSFSKLNIYVCKKPLINNALELLLSIIENG